MSKPKIRTKTTSDGSVIFELEEFAEDEFEGMSEEDLKLLYHKERIQLVRLMKEQLIKTSTRDDIVHVLHHYPEDEEEQGEE